jgi:alkylation response protein AidB-like acyl-CoA dehydrogenase
MNAPFPERYGGTGASDVDGALIGEELGWGCAAIATTLGINELAAAPVLLGGSEQIKAKYPRNAHGREQAFAFGTCAARCVPGPRGMTLSAVVSPRARRRCSACPAPPA